MRMDMKRMHSTKSLTCRLAAISFVSGPLLVGFSVLLRRYIGSDVLVVIFRSIGSTDRPRTTPNYCHARARIPTITTDPPIQRRQKQLGNASPFSVESSPPC